MRKIALLSVLLASFISFSVNAQVSVSGATFGGIPNSSNTFSTFGAAFTALNGESQSGAVITISVTTDVTELAAGAVLNNGAWTSITISPSGGAARTVSTAAGVTAGSPLIDLNGADNVTINGLNTGGNSLTFVNTTASATAGTSTIRLQNDAIGNTITNCTISGSSIGSTSVLTGNIVIGTTINTAGNDNNTISNCDLGPAGANLPTKAIALGGSSNTNPGTSNHNITINNNNIFDYFSATIASEGIDLFSGTTFATISNNRFYQGATRTQTTASTHSAININNTGGSVGYSITGNTIGYATKTQTGVYTLVMVAATKFVPIQLSVNSTAATSVQGNTIAAIAMSGAAASTTTTAPFRGIWVASGLTTIGDVTGNTIGSMSATGSITYTSSSTSASDIMAMGNNGSANWTVANNNIGGFTLSNSSTGACDFFGFRNSTASASTFAATNNTIGGTVANSIISNTAAATGSFVHGFVNTIGICVFTGNTIRNLTAAGGTGTTTSASVIGINISTATPNHTLSQNTIFNLSNTNTAAATIVTGIQFTGSTANIVERNLIYGLTSSTNSTAAEINGIRVAGGTTTYRNNMIALGAGVTNAIGTTPTNSSTVGINGINEALGTDNFFHNSVYIGGSATAGAGASFAFNGTQTTNTRSFRDNIFVNVRTRAGAATGSNYAIKINGTAANPAGLTINNNLYYNNGTGTTFGFFNSLDVANLAAWKSAATGPGQDAGSIFGDPQYNAPTNTTPDLHLHPTNTTPAEGNGVDVGVTLDYDGQTRSGLTPVDIGADAGNFTGLDLSAPIITHTAASFTCSTGDRTLTATITDATGVPAAGSGTEPRIYYKKNAGSYFSTPGTLSSGTVNNGVWSFTIVAANMGGLAVADVVSYYIVAQDAATPTPNIGSSPAGVATGTVLSHTAPGSPNTYSINNSLAGTYSVGAGNIGGEAGHFATITAAIAGYNTSCLSGAVIFSLTDAAYTEAAAMTINANPFASAINTLTIKPTQAATTIVVTGGSASAIFILNGADWVTIDGSTGSTANTVCPASAASRNLTITNTNTGTSSAVVWLQTTAGNDAATNNTIKNCNLVGNSNTTTLIGVGSGSSTISTASLGTGNNNNSFVNNNISKTQFGIFSQGASAANKNSGNVINQNLVNTASPNNVATIGILVGFENSITISANNIGGMAQTSSPDVFGISLGTTGISTSGFTGNEVTNASVTKNIIGSIRNTGTFSACGIFVAPATSGTNLIANNMLSGVSANGTSGDFTAGILIGGGAGSTTNIYHNTVNLQGTQTGGSDKSYCLAIGGSNPTVDVRNNIFVNTQNNGSGLNYAMGLGYSTFTALTSNNNDFFTTTGALFAIGGTASLSAPTVAVTLTDFQTATGKDAASINVSPVFAGATDLHLIAASNPLINNAGTPILSITDDVDCEVRSLTTPDIGADEITAVSCTTASAGTASGDASGICSGTSATITATASSTGTGSSYTWQSSSSNTFTSPTTVGTSPGSVNLTTVPGTTYYRLVVGCSTDASTVTSNTITISAINCTYDITYSTGAAWSSIMPANGGSGLTYAGWVSATSGDDNTSLAVSLTGTTFQYQGQPVTGFRACTNGWMTFNTATTSVEWTNDLTSTAQNQLLAPFWDDLVVTGQVFSNLNTSMRYQVIGTLGSGSAIIVAEWAGMERFNIAGPNLNFQVRMYEGSNNIEFVYGNFEGSDGTVTSAWSYTVGYNGTTPSGTGSADRFMKQTNNFFSNFWGTTGQTAGIGMPDCFSKFTLTPGVYTGPTSTPATPVPSNDNIATPVSLTVNTVACTAFCGTYYTSQGATNSALGTASCSTAGFEDDDVWFTFVSNGLNTQYTITLRNSPSYDGVLQYGTYNGSVFTPITCANATSAGLIESIVTGQLAAGTYYVRVFHNGTSFAGSGQFSICINVPAPPPANDNIAGAITLTSSTSCINTSGSTISATASPQAVCGGTPDDDVWYSFVAQSANLDVITVTGLTTFNAHVQVFSSSDNTATGTLTSLGCINNTTTGGTETFTGSGLTPGNRYFVRVYHTTAGTASGNFTICYTYLPPCVAPTTQPTSLTFPPANTGSGSIGGSFTAAAAPGATGYIVLRTPTGTAPTTDPVSGTTYTTGNTLGNATVVSFGTTTTFNASGLRASTTYRFTVYSYNGICTGQPAYNTTTPLFNEAATSAPVNISSFATGSWKNPNTWNPAVVPNANDFVTIAAGHVITIDTTAFDSTLTVIGTLVYDATTAFSLTSGATINVTNTGIFSSAATGTQTGHQLIAKGDLSVVSGGTLDLSTNANTAGATLVFADSLMGTTNTFAANGTVDLRTLSVNKGLTKTNYTIDITGNGFTVQGTSVDGVAQGFVTLTNGQLKLSMTASPTSSRLFSSASYTIPATAGLWLNTTTLTVSAQTGSPTVNGSLRVTAGTYNVGTAADNSLGAGAGAVFTIDGANANINVAGAFTSTSDVTYTQSAGTVTVNTVGNTLTTTPSFGFTSTGVANTFTMSGGNIIIQKPTATTGIDYRNSSGTQTSITGGTLQFGTATTTANSTFVISNNATTTPVITPSILIGGGSVDQRVDVAGGTGTGAIFIFGNLNLPGANDSLRHTNTGGQQIRVTGNVVNNGGIALSPGNVAANRFFFDSTTAARTYSGTGTFGSNAVPYTGVSFNNPNGVGLAGATNNIITNRINLFRGAVTGAGKITLGNVSINPNSGATVQVGGVPYASAGSLDANPVNNVGTGTAGGFILLYSPASTGLTTGFEIPVSRNIKILSISNTNDITLGGGTLFDSTLILGGGQLLLANNTLTVTGGLPSSVTRTSGWVNNGLFRNRIPAGANTGTYLFPLGTTTTGYAAFEMINPTLNAVNDVQAEFTTASFGSTAGLQMASLNGNGIWAISNAGGVTSTRVRVTSSVVALDATDALAESSTIGGSYDYVGSASLNVPAGTISSDPTPLITSLGFFTIGKKDIQMVFDSAYTFQTPGITKVYKNTGLNTNQLLLGVRVTVTNNLNPLSITSLTFNLNGSVPFANVDQNLGAVRVYSTGNSSTFATTNSYGDDVTPTYNSTLVFSSSLLLVPGDNYFWLAIDISGAANVNDTIDAQCVSVNISGIGAPGTVAPTLTNPAGVDVIKEILSGDYSVGAGNVGGEAGHFATLDSAINTLNDAGVSGPVNFLLTDALYTVTTAKTINQYPGDIAGNPVTIKPAVSGVTITGNIGTAIFVLNGADYVTIDGSVGTTANTICPASAASRDLTIRNTSTSTSSAVVWLQSTATDSATNNTVKNCNIIGSGSTQTLVGVGSGSTTIGATTASTRANVNNSFINNSISAVQNGITSNGVSATRKSSGTVINQNVMTNLTAPNNVSIQGIVVGFENGVIISGNTVAGMSQSSAPDVTAIAVGMIQINTTGTAGNEVTNATVTNNVIGSVINSGTFGAAGIAVAAATSGTTLIANNRIYGVIANGTGSDFAGGIILGGGTGSVTNVYHNTVSMQGTIIGGSSGSDASTCFAITNSTMPTVNMKNNIFTNTQLGNTGSTTKFSAIGLAATVFTGFTSNNNDLYCAGAGPGTYQVGFTGGIGTTSSATLVNWQTATSQDGASKNVLPVFLGTTDLHLDGTNASNTGNLVGFGAPLAAVTTDIDCETRSVTAPTIGADELVPCSGANGGLAVAPANSTFCGSSAAGTTITASGYSSSFGSVTAPQWQSSPDNFATPGLIVNIAGANNPASYTISPAVTATTYFRLKTTCSSGTSTAFSNIITIIVNPNPTVSLAPQSGSLSTFCLNGPSVVNNITLQGTSDAATPYEWKYNGVTVGGETGITYSLPSGQTGTYRFIATGANGCKDSASIVVSSKARPGTVTITPPSAAICAGSSQGLAASGGVIGSTGNITLGTGANTTTLSTDGTPYRMGNTVGNQFKNQYLFRASELQTAGVPAGNITSVELTIAGSGGGTLSNFTVKMGTTNQTTMTSTYVTGLTSVLSLATYPASGTVTTGVQTHTFTTPFIWDGTSNVVLEICAQLATSGSAGTLAGDDVTYAGTILNNPTVTGCSGTSGGGTSTIRPKVTFGYINSLTPTWSWTGANLNTNAGTTVTATPSITTVYTAIATDPVAGCTNTKAATVTVNNPPTSAVLSGNASICAGSSTNLSVAITGGTAPFTVNYTDGVNGFPVTNYNSGDPILVTPSGTRTYSLVSVFSTGTCPSPSNSGTALVTVSNPSTSAVLTGDATICAGSSTNLQVAITGGTSPYTVVLTNGVTVNNYVSGTNIPVSPAGNTVYTIVSVTTSTGSCVGTGNSGSATVTVNPIPTITSAASTTGVFRLGNSQNTPLTYSATSGTPTTYSIVWDAAALAAGFVNVTDAPLPASPIQIVVAANTDAATYNGVLTVKNAGLCPSTPGNAFTVQVSNANPTWTGNTNTNWNLGSNWSTGVIPAGTENITIDAPRPNYPVLITNISVGGTLDLAPGSKITIGSNTFTVTGGILPNLGVLVGSNTSNLVVGANSTVRLSQTTGENVLKNLTVNAGTATLATPVDITGGTALNTNGVVKVTIGATLASGGNLTFKSNQFGTARLDSGATTGQWVTGNVTVERYIPANPQRAWRFLSVPTKGSQTINAAWQEGATPANFNPKPTFGTRLTTPLLNYSAVGFDERTAKASIQFFSQATGAWVDVNSTLNSGNAPQIESVKGYAVYVRGDRTQAASGAVTSTNPTTLRTTGTLYTGNQGTITINPNKFDLLGNTYVSAIDFLKLTKTPFGGNGIATGFYLWDPKLVTGTPPNQVLGGYVSFTLANSWVGVPNSSSYGLTPRTTIQSGESFMISAGSGGGTIVIPESAKVTGDGINYFRPTAGFEKLKANLYTVATDNTTNMADANVSVFDAAFANAVDGDDAIKLSNGGENFAIRRDNHNLVVEGRQVTTEYDTTYFIMWNMRQAQQYRLELIAENMNVEGRSAFLIDKFLNTTTQLDLAAGTTNYDFTITSDPLSANSGRFNVLYRQVQPSPVPVSFISLNAHNTGSIVKLDWKVAGESGIRQYVVERSADGRKFTGIGNVTATGNSSSDVSYSWMDATPLTGSNFYRVKSIGVAGDVKYTYIVKVLMGSITPSYTIAPNPVEGSVINIQFKNQEQGRYTLRLLATGGETVFTTVTEHAGGNSTQVVTLPSGIARGAYQLEIISPDKKKEVQNLFINTLK